MTNKFFKRSKVENNAFLTFDPLKKMEKNYKTFDVLIKKTFDLLFRSPDPPSRLLNVKLSNLIVMVKYGKGNLVRLGRSSSEVKQKTVQTSKDGQTWSSF